MSQIKLQSLIFLCPVCNITKYVNIQKYINNILNVNKHKLTCPLCINNYIGINNLIIHIITDHKNLLSVTDGNVSVNLNNFAGNNVITNVESIGGDLKIRERHVDGGKSERHADVTIPKTQPFSTPFIQTFTIDDLGHSKRTNGEYVAEGSAEAPIIINPDSDLVILESVTSETYSTRITTSPVGYTEFVQSQQALEKPTIEFNQVNCNENAAFFQQKAVELDEVETPNSNPGVENDSHGTVMGLRPDSKVPEEMCFIDNNFCDRFFDYNKFKDNSEIDGLKFDIDQFLNEMSNANLASNDVHLETTNEPQHMNEVISDATIPSQIMHLENPNESAEKSNFIWNEVNSMNQLFNMNQMNLLQTNVILEESNRENQVDKLNTLYVTNPDENKAMEESLSEAPCDMTQTTLLNVAQRTLRHQYDGQALTDSKLFDNNIYESMFQTHLTSKRPKSNLEEKPNRLKMFKEKQNKFKNQRLKKLQLLTMNKKFEDHLFLDEARRDVTLDLSQNIASPNAYGIAILKNGGDFVTNKRQNEHTGESNSKHARTLSEEGADTPKRGGHFKCESCNFLFQNADILAMHNQLIHNHPVQSDVEGRDDERKAEGGFSNKCSYCPRVFKMKGSLMIHLKVAHLGLSNSSTTSTPSSSSKPESKRVTASPPQSFSCTLCSKSFKKEPHLLQHLKTHEGKQWECKLCSKLFTTKYFLKKHNRLHTGEMPYKCLQCDKCFTFQQSFHKHLLYHSDEKPYVCSTCGRAFKELSTLHNHERIHSGEKPFCCEICGKSFRQRVSYLVHQRIHTGVTPYKCSACHKLFRYKISDKMHKCEFGTQGRIVKTQNPLIEKLLAKSREQKMAALNPTLDSNQQTVIDPVLTVQEDAFEKKTVVG